MSMFRIVANQTVASPYLLMGGRAVPFSGRKEHDEVTRFVARVGQFGAKMCFGPRGVHEPTQSPSGSTSTASPYSCSSQNSHNSHHHHRVESPASTGISSSAREREQHHHRIIPVAPPAGEAAVKHAAIGANHRSLPPSQLLGMSSTALTNDIVGLLRERVPGTRLHTARNHYATHTCAAHRLLLTAWSALHQINLFLAPTAQLHIAHASWWQGFNELLRQSSV
eukprot:CAMPEP_0206464124 /NCGR_PEP_ID=MMETSP0324_2-20121206/27027_1 /ASSEMBLY_ACC=CAM_ASM_000836 /TAXON_ID=2866 /ORGANISM="Crypthecodinium cohnii, Strain Seligo" /LENGTH=223 /DNA_ID=CAMNT_0053936691 /DNA_START=370 /DNA_END=1042 /DNA_ORIENTATION=-